MKSEEGIIALTAIVCVAYSLVSFAGEDGYMIGAYYFGAWSDTDCNVCTPGHGCDGDPLRYWCGCKQYVEGTATQIPPEAPWYGYTPGFFDHYEPAIGFYDNSQTDTFETHIKQARANGLDYFIFHWYWDESLDGGTGNEKQEYIRTYLSTVTRYDMKFALSIVSQYNPIPSGHWSKAVTTIVGYLQEPNYALTTDGRPVVFFTDVRAIGDGTEDNIRQFLQSLDAATDSALGVAPVIAINIQLDRPDPDPPAQPFLLENIDEVDAYSCAGYYGLARTDTDPEMDCRDDVSPPAPVDDPPVGSHVQYNSAIVSVFREWANKPSGRPIIPCYMASFDERPRTESHIWMDWCHMRYLTDWDPTTTLEAGLQGIKSFSDAWNGGVVDNWIGLYAWNEWREAGHNLEPNASEGNIVLEKIAQVFQLETFGSQACKEVGDCPISIDTPTGGLDQWLNCRTIEGWGRDPDTSLPTRVMIFNGPYDPATNPDDVARPLADLYRNDPGWPYPSRYHGFSVRTPPEFITGQDETVHLYVQDLDVNGNWTGATTHLPDWETINCDPLLFEDGFESGDVSVWTSSCPPDCR